MTNKEIADKLKVSNHTVRNHLASVFRKLGVQSRTEAVLTYLQGGLLSINILSERRGA